MPYRAAIKDYSNEDSVFSAPIDPTAVPADADLTALHTALAGMTIGTVGDGILILDEVKDAGSSAIPASAFAQRELKWLVSFTSSTNKSYRREIACPDASLLGAGSDQVDLADPAVAAFVTAFETVARVREGVSYNTVTVTSIQLVGRKV